MAPMSRCYVDEMQEIFDEINAELVKTKQRVIKKRDWHEVLSTFTPNTIRPHWVNECFRKSFFDQLNATKVQTAVEEHLASLSITRTVTLICSDNK